MPKKSRAPSSAPPSAPSSTRSPATVDDSRRTLTPTSWIEAATEVLVDEGISHVRIDVLARQLGVTRGSFYWHFRDREDLLERVLLAWSDRTTDQLTRRLEDAGTDPGDAIRDLISLPFRGRAAARAARIELAIRTWARRDDAARAAVDRSDAIRLAYHTQLFVALGFVDGDAKARAFLLYGYEIAESLMRSQGTDAERRERSALVERLVRQPLSR